MGFTIPFTAQLEAAKLPSPQREYTFWKGRQFKFDYAWPALRIALEVEGGLFGRGKACPVCNRKGPGAHTSVERLLSDREKYNRANILGWTLIRARPEEMESGVAVDLVEFAILAKKLREDRMPAVDQEELRDRCKAIEKRVKKAG